MKQSQLYSLYDMDPGLDDLGFEEVHTFNSLADRAPGLLVGKKILVSARRGGQ